MTRVRDHFLVPMAVINVYATNKCNFLCGHCITSSGPKERNILSGDQFVQWFEKIDHLNNVKAFHISGGEPFLNLNLLSGVCEVARKLRLQVGVNTNGFWHKNQRIRNFINNNNDVITDLFLSTSEWHISYQTVNDLKESIEFALDSVECVELMFVKRSDGASDLMNNFKSYFGNRIAYSESIVEHGGRAVNYLNIEECKPNYGENDLCDLVNRMTILESGDVIMCSNTYQYSQGNTGLLIGNLNSESIHTILKNHSINPLVKSFQAVGPKSIASFLIRNGIIESIKNEKQPSMCEWCTLVTSSKETVDSAISYLECSPYLSVLRSMGRL
jgi:hypothetical protein